jgi:L-threonylcarbamoyladenylate synthase
MIRLDLKTTKKEEILAQAVSILNKGGVIIYPTETCYGVGVRADNKEAVSKVLKYKRRPEGKAVSVAVNGKDMAQRFVELNNTALGIYTRFLPGPITVISKSKHVLDNRLEAEDGTLGIRVLDFELLLQLIEELDAPITATSANSAGKRTPYSIDTLLSDLTNSQKQAIDLILDAGELPHNPPSSVIDTTKQELKILRRGGFSLGEHILTREINSELDMQRLGAEITAKYRSLIETRPMIVMFNADLGAGKTQFIKGMAQELGVTQIVNSPTFIIMKEYEFPIRQAQGKLIHLDAWRLESIAELKKIKLEQYFKPRHVIAVEWAGMARDYLAQLSKQKDLIRLYIEIDYLDLGSRKVVIYEE